jgi:hypothetical protein
MKKISLIFISLFLLFGCSKKEEVKQVEKKPYYSPQSFPTEYLSPSNIQWTKEPLPIDIESSDLVKKWLERVGQETVGRWSYVSLLSDKNEQIVLQGSSPSSGGINFLVLSKKSDGFNELVEFIGGFIFYSIPNTKPTLVVYNKSGLEYQRTQFEFDGKYYKQKSTYEVPIELTRLNGSPVDFHQYFWYMNTGEIKK